MADYVSAQVSLTKMDFPVGTILMYPFTTSLPKGWLLCDGTGYAIATYPALYSAIGLTYGSSGGFQVPNMSSRVPVGSGGDSPGATGGATSVALTPAQTGMVGHKHINYDASMRGANQCDTGSNDYGSFNDINYGGNTGGVTEANGLAHENLQPYLSMYFIIKALP
jgi:microcystin-dependent protein